MKFFIGKFLFDEKPCFNSHGTKNRELFKNICFGRVILIEYVDLRVP